jgi:TorA maturation chaperone TorD
MSKHLGAWIGPFTSAMRGGAASEYYRLLADLTDRFVEMERGTSGR